MAKVPLEKKRNVALVGHGTTGKTTLAEAILYLTGVITRMGSVEDGNTVSDFLPEEKERGNSISASILPLNYEGHHINLVDTPGFLDFVGEMVAALRAVDGAVIVLNGAHGVEPQAIRAWEYCEMFGLPRLIFINQLDRENADFSEVVAQCQEIFGSGVAPLFLPVKDGHQLTGLVNLLEQQLIVTKDGKVEVGEPPAELADTIAALREKLIDSIVEHDDELMEAYLEGEEPSLEKLREVLRESTLRGELVPVVGGSAKQMVGTKGLLDLIIRYLPDPSFRQTVKGQKPGHPEEEVVRETKPDAPFAARVFKQLFDPALGEITFFRVYSGLVRSGDTVLNSSRDGQERIGSMMMLRGKERITATEAEAGDIVATVKLKDTHIGDTLCDGSSPVVFPPIPFPSPLAFEKVATQSRDDLEKAAAGLHQLVGEDPTLKLEQNRETGELVIYGMGQLHLEVVRDRLRSRYGVEVTYEKPEVNYRETLRSKVQGYGRHKKQTGGRGQFGDVYLELEPITKEEAQKLIDEPPSDEVKARNLHDLPWGGVLLFEDAIKGGVIPQKFIPAVEKGVLETMEQGVLARYPIMNLRARVYDGKYHPVDSSEIAFKLAANLAFKDAFFKDQPVLLEPIMKVRVIVPEEFTGDVMGDLNSRRGRVQGMEAVGGGQQAINALVPLAEMYGYINTLRSITQGRGYFEMEFSHYEELPGDLQQKIIAERERQRAEAS